MTNCPLLIFRKYIQLFQRTTLFGSLVSKYLQNLFQRYMYLKIMILSKVCTTCTTVLLHWSFGFAIYIYILSHCL